MNSRKLHFYAYTFCRYFLATIILSYAFAKILGTQFTTQPSTYDRPIESLSGFELTWYYFGYSKWYGTLIAVIQIISSLFLFFRKTTRIGVMLFLSFMVNILLTDFAYDIEGAKGMASLLTAMALFVLFSDYSLFYKYFIEEPPLFNNNETPDWIGRYRNIKWIYIPFVFIGFFLVIYNLKNKYMPKDNFYGTWQNIDNSTELNRLNFEAANTFKINEPLNNKVVARGGYTFTKDTLSLNFLTNQESAILYRKVLDGSIQLHGEKMLKFFKGRYKVDKNILVIEIGERKKIFFKRIR